MTSANYSNPHGGGASASASVGPLLVDGKTSLTMKAFATATGGSGDEGQYIANGASASAYWDEELSVKINSFAIPDGKLDTYLQFMFQMNGSKSGDATAYFQFTDYDIITGQPLVQQKDLDVFDGDFDQSVPFLIVSNPLDLAPLQHLTFTLNVHATGFGSGLGGPATSTADYSHTVTLLSITPRDADGNFIPGVTIDSTSGFDYNSIIVPEPSSLALVAMASACLLLGRMFRREQLGPGECTTADATTGTFVAA